MTPNIGLNSKSARKEKRRDAQVVSARKKKSTKYYCDETGDSVPSGSDEKVQICLLFKYDINVFFDSRSVNWIKISNVHMGEKIQTILHAQIVSKLHIVMIYEW